jgi:hypothetical protein
MFAQIGISFNKGELDEIEVEFACKNKECMEVAQVTIPWIEQSGIPICPDEEDNGCEGDDMEAIGASVSAKLNRGNNGF